MRDNARATFAPAPLDHVVGGAWTRPTATNPQLVQLLQQTTDSVKDMVRAQKQTSDQLLPMMMAMMMMRR